MADGSSTSGSSTSTTAPSAATSYGLISGLKAFAAAHGGATAVVEYVGRRGARIVLAGEDGAWGDHLVESTDSARSACERAGIRLQNEWERELNEQMRPSNDLWRSMGRRSFSR
jgi:hypothetical protein